MSIESSGYREPEKGNCNDAEAETATQKTIRLLKEDYCTRLKGKVAELGESELTYDGAVLVYQKKKCSLVKTEKNYLLARNLELKVCVELITAAEEIKKNVTADIAQNDALVIALKAVLKTAKDAKTKFGELREAAGKLDGCRKDSCNAGQMKILGCIEGDDCNDNSKQEESPRRPDPCKNVCQIIDELISAPDSLSLDIDIITNSTAEIVGIQSFSNIKSLEIFQQDFSANAKAMDDLLLTQITNGGLSLKKAQDDFILSTKTITQSGYALYNKRNEVGTLDKTKDYLCHHECSCIAGCDEEKGEYDNRLKKCKCDICDICKEVIEVYSCESPTDQSSCD